MKARLKALATAVPPHRLLQDEIRALAREVFRPRMPDFDRLESVFGNAGVAVRHSCVPLSWFRDPHGWPERNDLYQTAALDLLETAASEALAQAGMTAGEMAGLVCVSSTGIATPSLEAMLMARLDFPSGVRRLPIFGFGCGGGALGLARAAMMAEAMPGKPVLLLVVELCSLSFRRDDPDKNNIISTSLFGDGAAAAILVAGDGTGPMLLASGEQTWRDQLDLMGWRIEADGMAVEFGPSLPVLLRQRLRGAAEGFLAEAGYRLADLDGVICHPGGPRILGALEESFFDCADGLEDARSVLRDYGNMSAATVLFVLRRSLDRGRRGRRLLSAVGPGFTVGFGLLAM